MTGKYSPVVVLAALGLSPVAAYASFNSFGNGPLCSNLGCVLGIGVLAGFIGAPVSAAIFWALALIVRRGPKPSFAWMCWVVANGAVAYVITIVVLLLGPSHSAISVYVYFGYGVLFTVVSYLGARLRTIRETL